MTVIASTVYRESPFNEQIRKCAFYACACGLLAFVSVVNAAQVNVVDGRYEGEKYVAVNGPITTGDIERIKTASVAALKQGNGPLTLLLNSEGGDVAEALTIGRYVRAMMATTYVYGNALYIRDSPAGKELEASTASHLRFHLRSVQPNAALTTDDVVRCYSSCVLIFYGGVQRHASSNSDFRRGIREMTRLPVIGLHRPYYAQEGYSQLNAAEARAAYGRLEQAVRYYLLEMGAPTTVADRMFGTASNNVDLLYDDDFAKLYRAQEPFIEEWLIAKCKAAGPNAALDGASASEYHRYMTSLKAAIGVGRIRSQSDYDGFNTAETSATRARQLEQKILTYNTQNMACRKEAVRHHQIENVQKF